MNENGRRNIRILSTTSPRAAVQQVAAEFEHAAGIQVVARYLAGSQMGANTIRDSEADVLITSRAAAHDAEIGKLLLPGTWREFARSTMGVAVPVGMPKPRLDSMDAFVAALRAAKIIALSPGPSGSELLKGIEGLGIGDEVKAKLIKPLPGELVGAVLGRGGAEIGLQQLSELLAVDGIQIVGPVPDELQKPILYGAGTLISCKTLPTADAFIRYLCRPETVSILDTAGLRGA